MKGIGTSDGTALGRVEKLASHDEVHTYRVDDATAEVNERRRRWTRQNKN